MDTNRRDLRKETYNVSTDYDKPPSSFSSNTAFNAHEETGVTSSALEKERFDVRSSVISTGQKTYSTLYSQNSADTEEKVQKVSPPRRKVYRDEKLGIGSKRDAANSDLPTTTSYKQQITNNSNAASIGSFPGLKRDGASSDLQTTSHKQQISNNPNAVSSGSKQSELEPPDESINEILEVGFECTTSQ